MALEDKTLPAIRIYIGRMYTTRTISLLERCTEAPILLITGLMLIASLAVIQVAEPDKQLPVEPGQALTKSESEVAEKV